MLKVAITLEDRFQRLRRLMVVWENAQRGIEEEVLLCFERDDLAGITHLMEEKKRLLRRMQKVRNFIEKWET